MKAVLSDRYKLLFIVFVSLGIYYPSIFGEANTTDDELMMTFLINTDHIAWKDIFLPMRPLYYYRPVLSLTFLFDRFAFNCSASFMHLGNIIIHTINGVLVFFIVKEMLTLSRRDSNPYVPLFAALLFVLNPLNTESVNWISGRTDVLSGMFVFISFLLFLKGITRCAWCWMAALFFLMGMFSKEVALGLVAVAGLFLILKEEPVEKLSARERLRLLLPFIVVSCLYFLIRTIAAGFSDTGIATATTKADNGSLLITISGAVKAFGFYIKKLFVPLPLNFGIVEIQRTFYFWFGITTLALSLYLLFRRRTLLSFFFLFAVPFFLPAIPIAISRMAWTPLAERYLYISSFGVSTLIVLVTSRLPWKNELIYGALTILVTAASAVTVQRNITWQNNLTLYEDTVRKSPTFAAARNEYAIALAKKGRHYEALEQFQLAESLAGTAKYRELPALNIIGLEGSHEKPEELKRRYAEFLAKYPSSSSAGKILKELIKITNAQIKEEKDPRKQKDYYREHITYAQRLFELDNNGFYLYRIGQLYLALGEEATALEYFKKAVVLSPSEFFSDPARTLIQRLDEGNS